MELQVAVPFPPPATEFNFDSTCSSPYITAPSSPRRFGTGGGGGNFYFSAPASPTRISAAFYSVPFQWEDKPGVPAASAGDDGAAEFEFDFSGHLDRSSLSAADELFDGGKIRPLKPPPGGTAAGSPSPRSSPRSPRSMISHALSVKKKKDLDPFAAAAAEETTRRARSLSPMRVSDVVFSPEIDEASAVAKPPPAAAAATTSAYSAILSVISGGRKWRLRDLLLFRSASEGRAPRNDDVLRRTSRNSGTGGGGEEARNSSFRSTDSAGSVSSRRRGGAAAASAHEIHYTANRAVSEEMRKRTFLPYKQGLLGCLGFTPRVHQVSRRFGSLSRA